jgi:uroporphyrinogen-III synthase
MPNNTLQGLSVVVTRPAHQAVMFQQQLLQHGGRVLAYPAIAVQACTNLHQITARLAQLPDYDAAIFISSNAVQFGLALLDTSQRAQLQQLTLGAIGSKTARSLQAAGLRPVWIPPTGFTSEDFLAMPAVQHLTNRRIVIFRGEGGRELLADTLRQRGASVDYLDVYQRICPKNDISELKHHHDNQQLDIIAITSSEGLLNLLTLLGNPEWIKTVPLLVGSQRMATTARKAGFTGQMVIADNPGDEAMFAALSQWAQEFSR